MPGQPAWTLTEMLECNLPLCWAGGGDCNVGPAQSWADHFFSLKPIRAIGFIKKKKKSDQSCAAGFFFRAVFFSKEKRCEAAVVTGGSWCWAFFFGAENRRAVGVFLEQKNLQRQFFFLAEKRAR